MKGTLEFNLYEDQEAFEMAIKSVSAFSALSEFRSYLKYQLKCCDDDKKAEILEAVQDKFFDIISDNSISDLT